MTEEKQNFNLFPPHPSTASLASLPRVDTFPSRGRLSSAVRTLAARRSSAIIIAKDKIPRREFFERGAGKSFLPKKVSPVKNRKFLTQANYLPKLINFRVFADNGNVDVAKPSGK